MSDEKSKKKLSKSTLVFYAIITGALIWLLICRIIPYGINLWRRINIIRDMESVYSDAEFVTIKCDIEPTDKAELEGQYIWYGGGLPEDDLYAFLISDSKDNPAMGFATKNGTVVFDTYAAAYYEDDAVEYLKNTVDFEHNFPGVGYFITASNIINAYRLVLTHDCTTFEGFRKAGTVGWFVLSGGYPGLFLYLDDASEETTDAIEGLLTDANFDIYVMFIEAENDLSGIDNYDDLLDNVRIGDDCGSYYPFGKSYEEAILGK